MTSYIQEECYRMEMEAQKDSLDSESAQLQAMVDDADAVLEELEAFASWKD